jgi:hypothetical protein
LLYNNFDKISDGSINVAISNWIYETAVGYTLDTYITPTNVIDSTATNTYLYIPITGASATACSVTNLIGTGGTVTTSSLTCEISTSDIKITIPALPTLFSSEWSSDASYRFIIALTAYSATDPTKSWTPYIVVDKIQKTTLSSTSWSRPNNMVYPYDGTNTYLIFSFVPNIAADTSKLTYVTLSYAATTASDTCTFQNIHSS